MEFADLKKHLKTQKPFPCYCCYGDDEYVLSRAVALIKELAAEPAAFNVADKEFASFRELKDELMQLPLTGEYRIVVARGKTDISALSDYLKAPNPSTVLVTASFIPHDSWNRTATPDMPVGATAVDCNRLPLTLVSGFVNKTLAETGAVIEPDALKALYDRCGGYMTRINSEVKKLGLLCADKTVTLQTVNSEVEADTEFVVFELTDCIVKHDTAKALSIVDGMAKNNDLVAAFTLLYNRFKRMFAAAVDPDGLSALGVKPYMASRLKSEANAFSKVRLKLLLEALADADHSYKTGAVSQYDALYSFVAQASYGG